MDDNGKVCSAVIPENAKSAHIFYTHHEKMHRFLDNVFIPDAVHVM